jgi:hypothetical protein
MTEELQRIRIAEVMQYQHLPLPQNPSQKTWQRGGVTCSPPNYPTDLSACTALIDFLEKRGYACVMVAQHGKRCCTFTTTGRNDCKAVADTFPAAICKSFLTVLGLWES